MHPTHPSLPEPHEPEDAEPPVLVSGWSNITRLSVLLFVATCASTFLSGTDAGTADPEAEFSEWLSDGLSFSVPVMLILLCHEMGHFLTARWYGIPASPPLFVPVPYLSPWGTFGAVILHPRGLGARRTMFDVAIAGPLAGLIVAIPVAWMGVQQSELMPYSPVLHPSAFGDPPLLKGMFWLKFGAFPENHDVVVNPLLLAGWVGVVLTGVNLVPIGQSDGGHVVYGLLGTRAHFISATCVVGAIIFMTCYEQWPYLFMLLVLLGTGIEHPPSANDQQPLGWPRVLLGCFTMSLFFVCFTPLPILYNTPTPISPVSENRPFDASESEAPVP